MGIISKRLELEKEIAELKAENDRLKECNKELTSDNLNTIQEMDNERRRVEQFKAENELLREENLEEQKQYTEVVSANAQKIRQLKQTLQEIKAIAEKPKPFIDFSEIKTATEVEYDYAAICNELELRLHNVLELITKAESEG